MVIMVDRVRRPQKYDQLLKNLVDEKKIFSTYKDCIVFAACLGASRGCSNDFEKSSEPVNLQYFRGQFDEMVINTIAIAECDDPLIMSKEREAEKIRIFENYICGGLGILENEIDSGNLNTLAILTNLVLREAEKDSILSDLRNQY